MIDILRRRRHRRRHRHRAKIVTTVAENMLEKAEAGDDALLNIYGRR